MKRRTGLTAALVAAGALMFAACGSSDEPESEPAASEPTAETYTIATTIPFPPYTDQVDGEFVGFEKDLIAAVAEQSKFKIEIVNVPKFESLIPGMLSGRYDAAYDGFVDNPERHEQFKTINYYGSRWALAALADKFATGADLCGKRVATQTGSQPMEDALTAYSKETCDGNDIKKVSLPIGQQPSAVKSGRADAMVTDTISLPGLLEKNTTFAQVDEPYGEAVIGGLLVPAKNAELADRFVTGLKAIIADGTYDEIMGKWKLDDSAYKDASVNVTE
jgi:polar amino acid transport system substrate-binding protein